MKIEGGKVNANEKTIKSNNKRQPVSTRPERRVSSPRTIEEKGSDSNKRNPEKTPNKPFCVLGLHYSRMSFPKHTPPGADRSSIIHRTPPALPCSTLIFVAIHLPGPPPPDIFHTAVAVENAKWKASGNLAHLTACVMHIRGPLRTKPKNPLSSPRARTANPKIRNMRVRRKKEKKQGQKHTRTPY